MEDLRNRIEAVLFSSGKKMSSEDIAKVVGSNISAVNKAADELRKFYDDSGSSLMVVEGENSWKLSVREKFIPLVRKIVAETEFSKTVMETLAIVAWKAPVLQAEVIKIRTNKAYDHLSEIEEAGFITRVKFGRTKKISLTEKFFNYFDLQDRKDMESRIKTTRKQHLLPVEENISGESE